MPIRAPSPDNPYTPRLQLTIASPQKGRASEAAVRALPPAPPLPQPLINSAGQAIGTRINTVA